MNAELAQSEISAAAQITADTVAYTHAKTASQNQETDIAFSKTKWRIHATEVREEFSARVATQDYLSFTLWFLSFKYKQTQASACL